jgi:hypothetical protein
VLIVVRDLLAIHDYLGDLTRLMTRMQTVRLKVEAWLRRLLSRPGRDAVVRVGTVTASVGMAGSVTARVTPGPFIPQPAQPPPQQLAAHAEYLNRLRDWIMREVQQRDEAIAAERE